MSPEFKVLKGLIVKKRQFVCFSLIFVILPIIWFLGVDQSWFVESCDDCFYQRDIIKYRFFTIPIYQKVIEHHSVIELVADDPGVPCAHKDLSRIHKHRWWGLCFCWRPCNNGTQRLSNGGLEWYDKSKREIVDSMKIENTNLSKEFFDRVICNHDLAYWKSFKTELLKKDKPAISH